MAGEVCDHKGAVGAYSLVLVLGKTRDLFVVEGRR